MSRRLFSVATLLLLWAAGSWYANSLLLPSPLVVGKEMLRVLSESASIRHLLISLLRCLTGLVLAFCLGLVIGIPAGRKKGLMDYFAPLLAALQGCPTIVWISLLMVWAGVGSVVPTVAIFLATFPVVFINIAAGVSALEPRLFAMAHLYRVPRRRIITELILPGIAPYFLAAVSYTLGVCWKVAATAEFIGSDSGVGAQIYWAYRALNIPRLFCWALILILISMALEAWIIQPLSKRVKNQRGSANA